MNWPSPKIRFLPQTRPTPERARSISSHREKTQSLRQNINRSEAWQKAREGCSDNHWLKIEGVPNKWVEKKMGNLAAITISGLSRVHTISCHSHRISSDQPYIISYLIMCSFIHFLLFFTYSVLSIFQVELLLLVRTGVGHLTYRKEQGWPPFSRLWGGELLGCSLRKTETEGRAQFLRHKLEKGPGCLQNPFLCLQSSFLLELGRVWGLHWCLFSPCSGESRASECGTLARSDKEWWRASVLDCIPYSTNHMSRQNLPSLLGTAILCHSIWWTCLTMKRVLSGVKWFLMYILRT